MHIGNVDRRGWSPLVKEKKKKTLVEIAVMASTAESCLDGEEETTSTEKEEEEEEGEEEEEEENG